MRLVLTLICGPACVKMQLVRDRVYVCIDSLKTPLDGESTVKGLFNIHIYILNLYG